MHPLKEKYNRLLTIENKIGAWLDDPNVPNEEKEPFIPRYKALLDKLGDLLKQLKANGISYTDHEVLHGFTE